MSCVIAECVNTTGHAGTYSVGGQQAEGKGMPLPMSGCPPLHISTLCIGREGAQGGVSEVN